MRTASRIALVLTGTAMVIGVFATPGAHADRSRIGVNGINALTAQQRARPQPQPDRVVYVQAAKVMSIATAIAHLSAAPEVANVRRGEGRMETEVALATIVDGANSRSIAWSGSCDDETFAAQQVNASDGGRGTLAYRFEEASCPKESTPKRRTREGIVGDMDALQVLKSDPTPVVFKIEAVIKIDLAGLNW
jgi:hypothetical protein